MQLLASISNFSLRFDVLVVKMRQRACLKGFWESISKTFKACQLEVEVFSISQMPLLLLKLKYNRFFWLCCGILAWHIFFLHLHNIQAFNGLQNSSTMNECKALWVGDFSKREKQQCSQVEVNCTINIASFIHSRGQYMRSLIRAPPGEPIITQTCMLLIGCAWCCTENVLELLCCP